MSVERLKCPDCGHAYKWNPRIAGRKIKCRSCQALFRMAAQETGQPQLLRSVAGHAAKGGGSGYELQFEDAQTNETAAAAGPTISQQRAKKKKCPSCNVQINATAIICTQCGFNIQKGEKIQVEVGGEAELAQAAAKTAAKKGWYSLFGALMNVAKRRSKTAKE